MTENASKLWPALLRARQALGPIAKSATNPHFKSKYAPLGEVLAAVLPAARAEGLVVVAGIVSGDPPALRVQVIHAETGEATGSDVPLVGATTPQLLKSAQTYALRTGLEALFMVELDDDDDGNAASAAPQRQSAPQRPAPAPARPEAQGRAPARPQGNSGGGGRRNLTCPDCGKAAVIRGKAEFGGGYLCWKNATPVGGCGHKWDADTWDELQLRRAGTTAPADDDDPGFLSDL